MRSRRNRLPLRQTCFFTLLGLLVACGPLPKDGPSSREISAERDTEGYALILVDDEVSRMLASARRPKLGTQLPSASSPALDGAVGVGDKLHVTLFEAGRDGLFPRQADGGAATSFDAILVSVNGEISLPYVGKLRVVGLTTAEIEAAIVSRLEGRAIDPQASVSIVDAASSAIVLGGDIAKPGEYRLTPRGERLATVIAHAGGSRYPAYQTEVNLIRGTASSSARLDHVLLDSSQNIRLEAGDIIVLSFKPERYTLNGAVTKSGIFDLDSTSISVLEAVSRGGGMLDARSDAAGVFVFRYETNAELSRLGVYAGSDFTPSGEKVPTIYQLNLLSPKGRFHAQQFLLRDADAVYVANTESVQFGKLLRLLREGATTANATANLQ